MNTLSVEYMDAENNDSWSMTQIVRPMVGDRLWLPDLDSEPVMYVVCSVTLDLHADDFEIVCEVEAA